MTQMLWKKEAAGELFSNTVSENIACFVEVLKNQWSLHLYIHSSDQLNQNEGSKRLTPTFNLRFNFFNSQQHFVAFKTTLKRHTNSPTQTSTSHYTHWGFAPRLFQHPPISLTLSFSLSVDVRHLIKVSAEWPTQTAGFVLSV